MTVAVTSTLSRSFPTVKHVVAPFRWVARTRRRRWTAAMALLAILAVPVAWWSTQLIGLPDIGDGLDPQTSGAPRIPADRDANVLYRRAEERYRASGPSFTFHPEDVDSWSKAPPGLRRELEANREALALYREAAERPASSPRADGRQPGGMLVVLCLLEAARLEELGDMAGAWAWYRAILRSVHHTRSWASLSRRVVAQMTHDRIRGRLARWAVDPRTTPNLVRRALDDAIACRSISPPSDSYTLLAECLEVDAFQPTVPLRQVTLKKWNEIFGIPDYWLIPDQMQAVYDLWRAWHREPERSRRVIRLAVANWLAYLRLPPERRPPPDLTITGPYDFYAFGPEAPAGARALPPASLDRWLESSPEARQFLDWWVENRKPLIVDGELERLRAREEASDRALLDLLAKELDRRPERPGRTAHGPVQ